MYKYVGAIRCTSQKYEIFMNDMNEHVSSFHMRPRQPSLTNLNIYTYNTRIPAGSMQIDKLALVNYFLCVYLFLV